ncbi:HipA domain-containing protein [Pseudomonas sp. TCU-HL1]|uniref:HipA domain-containing protein n=1 Tax=Pseudomonas sp. TCU-HL1 TaxID=1856685 RepID=UPI00083D5502|nr:HipA domain-containing protein [Pseudomonas sp. TCU-HL1]AOE87632.1 toxin HipA [Pseudomonas sp. TCU-HL1]
MNRQLYVWINFDQVGVLAESNGLWTFIYTQDWLSNRDAYAISPSLPLEAEPYVDGASERPVQWFFDNLLPEEGQRLLIASSAGVGVEDAFGMLQHFGAESAGSITLLPPDQVPAQGELRALSFNAMAERIREMPHIPLAEQSLKRMSLAGAQHKVALRFEDDQFREPGGNEPSTHILKPDHPSEDFAHSVINEWFVMSLARKVGLPVPAVTRKYIPMPVYLVERFDRTLTATGWTRLHCVDACQALNLDRSTKYHAGSVERLRELSAMCRIPARARLQLFQWLTFNVLLGNTDAHLKNLSFLMSPRGLELAPFYDLLSTAVWTTKAFGKDHWPGAVTMAWPIAGEDRLERMSPELLVEAAGILAIKPTTARTLVNQLVTAVWKGAPELIDQVQRENEEIAKLQPEVRQTFPGEMRALRSIVSIIIDEMSRKLLP